MNERDLTRVLTEHVADVRLPDEAVRRIRMAVKEEKPVKKKMNVALALVMAMLLLASVAVAAGMGMLDFLSWKMGQSVLPGAEEIVLSDVTRGETEHVTYVVKQAVYDGRSVSLMVEMRPKDEGTLLLPEAWDIDLPYGALAYDTEAEMMADPRTIAEYAADNGYTRIIEGYVGFDLDSDVMGVDEWQDNTVTVVYSLNADGDTLTLPIVYGAFDKVTDQSWQATDELLLTASAPLWQVSSEESFDLPEYGVRIDGVRITGTALQSYWEVFYTVTDVEKAQNGGFRVEMLDAAGNMLPRGVLGVGGSGLAQHDGDELVWHGGFGASAEAPAQLILRIRSFAGDAADMLVSLE